MIDESTDDEPDRTSMPNRVWRLEHRQRELFSRMKECEAKLEVLRGKTGFSWDATFVRVIIYGLIAALVAVATGKLINFGG